MGLHRFFYRPLAHHLNSDLHIIGVIAQDNSHSITKESILNGEDSILVIDHASLLYQKYLQKIPQAKYLTPDDFFNVNNLHLLDEDNNSMITPKDRIYNHLFVIRFSSRAQETIQSLPAAGIKKIIIDNSAPEGNYSVLLADGTFRTLISFTKLEKS